MKVSVATLALLFAVVQALPKGTGANANGKAAAKASNGKAATQASNGKTAAQENNGKAQIQENNGNANVGAGNSTANGNNNNANVNNEGNNNNNRPNANNQGNNNNNNNRPNVNNQGNNNNNQPNGQGNNGNQNNPQLQDGSNDVNQAGRVDQQTALLMQTAVDAWMRDTGVVSNFLNIGQGLQDEQTFKNQALIAHSAEVDELTHKNVLDQGMPNNPAVKAANETLTTGAFQLVVDQLRDMAIQGRSAVGGIELIHNARCVNVLPNIDTYMREAANTIGNGQVTQQAVRPQACANVVAGQNGALNVNEIPQGYVNGKLQTSPPGAQVQGTSNTLPNIPQDASGDQPDTQF